MLEVTVGKRNTQRLKRKKIDSICRQHDCLHRKSQGIYKKIPRTINEFSKATAYKINIYKPIVFLATDNDHVDTKM